MNNNGHRENVIIRVPAPAAASGQDPFSAVPPSYIPTSDEIIQLQAAQITELERTLEARTVAASTIANAAINLLDVLSGLGYGSRDSGFVIEKDTWLKTRGLQLTVEGDEKTGKVTVRAREHEKPAPLAFEDRFE